MVSMGKLTPEQENFDVSQFFDPDMPRGEPVLQQVRDPFTDAVVGPGMRVDTDGTVNWTDGLEQT